MLQRPVARTPGLTLRDAYLKAVLEPDHDSVSLPRSSLTAVDDDLGSQDSGGSMIDFNKEAAALDR